MVPVGVAELEIYGMVDKALEVVITSGLKYEVGALETTLEGPYLLVMETIEKAHQAVSVAGAPQILVYIKLQINNRGAVSIEEKVSKWR